MVDKAAECWVGEDVGVDVGIVVDDETEDVPDADVVEYLMG